MEAFDEGRDCTFTKGSDDVSICLPLDIAKPKLSIGSRRTSFVTGLSWACHELVVNPINVLTEQRCSEVAWNTRQPRARTGTLVERDAY